VRPTDTEALAHAMLAYFTERSMARRHAKAARRIAETRFSLARMVGDYTELYERSLESAGISVRCAQGLAAG
jgi:glycosyltransferase involved in cell wall biosynthesis